MDRKKYILALVTFLISSVLYSQNEMGKSSVDINLPADIPLDFKLDTYSRNMPSTSIKLPDSLSFYKYLPAVNTDKWDEELNSNIYFVHNPNAFDYANKGVISQFKGFTLYGNSFRETMPGLLSRQSLSLSLDYNIDRFTLSTSFIANRFLVDRIDTQLGVAGSLSYKISDNLSATIFGSYYNMNPYYSMAALPYINSSSYGGFFTLQNSRIGIDLGVKQRYDPFRHRWEMIPIITPKYKINKVVIELPVGEMLKSTLEDAVFKNRRNGGGGTIMPDAINHNIPIR